MRGGGGAAGGGGEGRGGHWRRGGADAGGWNVLVEGLQTREGVSIPRRWYVPLAGHLEKQKLAFCVTP